MSQETQTKERVNSIYFQDWEIELLADIINTCKTKIKDIYPKDIYPADPFTSDFEFFFEQEFFFASEKLPIFKIITEKIKDVIQRYEEANDKKLLFNDKR